MELTEFIINTVAVSREDVEQEAHRIALEKGVPHTRISRYIVHAKLQRKQWLTYGILPNAQAWAPAELDGSIADSIIEQLIDWAYSTKDGRVIQLMLDFLENPEAKLKATLANLDKLGFLPKIESKPETEVKRTLSRLFENAIPAFKADLVNIVVQNSPNTERPASTVRQWLRRMVKQGKLEEGRDGRYYWSTIK